MQRFLIIVALIGIALPVFAQDQPAGFQFRGLTWGQKPAAAKQALAETATYKMEMTASDARRELYTTTFAERPAGLTLTFGDGELSEITLATSDTVPQAQATGVFDAWAATLTKSFGPPVGSGSDGAKADGRGSSDKADGAPEAADGGDASGMDLFGDIPEKRWKVGSTEVTLVQKTEGTGYGVVVTFRPTLRPASGMPVRLSDTAEEENAPSPEGVGEPVDDGDDDGEQADDADQTEQTDLPPRIEVE